MLKAHEQIKSLRSHSPSRPVTYKVLVIGSGNFGTCLADHLADLGNDVTILGRSKEVAESINKNHRNSKYLKDAELCPELKACTEVTDELFSSVEVLLFSIPTQSMRQVIASWKERLRPELLIVFVNKGIETSSLFLPCDIVKEIWGEPYATQAVYLSGPSFAAEIVQRQPTCVSVASHNLSQALKCQLLFHAPHFKAYDSTDVIGVELAGALKNVIAIASGACTGLGFANNARAALITRGLAEITRVGVAMGASPITFSGLSGVGDLFLTCTSELSRNFKVGYRIGKGEKLDYVLETLGSVAEGVETTRAAYQLFKKYEVDSPICNELYSVLFEGKPLHDAMKDLLMREAYSEFTFK